MEILRVGFAVMAVVALAVNLFAPSMNAQSLAPAPPPTSDGATLDQGIACILMLVALVITYIIH
ncbi:Arabinogalactan peptide 20 [Hibiscus syriacus]|uniref:Arabinogalactan peptide 20 n=2 Tax=Hibiscus syriacus TaxID=106335 RepID=A0A6A2WTM8_HIBSY|nr:Arabinogalactan peptide 20 [Hibiscus syriacus]